MERHSQVPAGLDGEGLPRDGRPRSRSQGGTGSQEAQSTRNVGAAEAGLRGIGARAPSGSAPWRSTAPEVSRVVQALRGHPGPSGKRNFHPQPRCGMKSDVSAPWMAWRLQPQRTSMTTTAPVGKKGRIRGTAVPTARAVRPTSPAQSGSAR